METVKVIVFDGSNAAHRLSNASAALTNARGERVEVIFGLLRLVSSVLRVNPADKCYLVWDGKGSKAIRKAIDPEYKAHRHDDPVAKERIDGMHKQVARFWELFGQYLPIIWATSEKYEADDIMAMLAHECVNSRQTCRLVTGDKDLLQLVNHFVTVFSPSKNKVIDWQNFSEFAGGFPEGFAYLNGKCLMGDSSDNIKGVGGVGEVGALRYLKAHEWSLTELKLRPNDELLKSKIGQHIISDSGWARISLNYKLMSLHGPAHKKLRPEVEIKAGKLNRRELQTNMARMQFASLMVSFTQFITPFSELEI